MYLTLIILAWSHDSEIWITFFFIFLYVFFKCHFKNMESCIFWIFKKMHKKKLLNYAMKLRWVINSSPSYPVRRRAVRGWVEKRAAGDVTIMDHVRVTWILVICDQFPTAGATTAVRHAALNTTTTQVHGADTSRHLYQTDPKAALLSRRKPPWNVLSHKPPQNF